MNIKFMDILNENKSKLTEEELKVLEHIKKDFEKKDAQEMKMWGNHIEHRNWSEYVDNYKMRDSVLPNMKSDKSKRNKMIKIVNSLITKGELIEVSSETSQYSHTKKYNFGRDKGADVSWSEVTKMIKPKDWEW